MKKKVVIGLLICTILGLDLCVAYKSSKKSKYDERVKQREKKKNNNLNKGLLKDQAAVELLQKLSARITENMKRGQKGKDKSKKIVPVLDKVNELLKSQYSNDQQQNTVEKQKEDEEQKNQKSDQLTSQYSGLIQRLKEFKSTITYSDQQERDKQFEQMKQMKDQMNDLFKQIEEKKKQQDQIVKQKLEQQNQKQQLIQNQENTIINQQKIIKQLEHQFKNQQNSQQTNDDNSNSISYEQHKKDLKRSQDQHNDQKQQNEADQNVQDKKMKEYAEIEQLHYLIQKGKQEQEDQKKDIDEQIKQKEQVYMDKYQEYLQEQKRKNQIQTTLIQQQQKQEQQQNYLLEDRYNDKSSVVSIQTVPNQEIKETPVGIQTNDVGVLSYESFKKRMINQDEKQIMQQQQQMNQQPINQQQQQHQQENTVIQGENGQVQKKQNLDFLWKNENKGKDKGHGGNDSSFSSFNDGVGFSYNVFPNSEGKAKQKYEEVSYYSVIEPTQPSFRTQNNNRVVLE